MGLREEIKKALHQKVVLRILGPEHEKEICILCNRDFNGADSICVHVLNEGNLCDSCSAVYAPDLLKAKNVCLNED